jgi:formylglycine-generating enzyme required for sulfatase activity
MVRIPAGEFEMGDHFDDGHNDDLPTHTVSLDDFYIELYEVTNAQYATFLNAMGQHIGNSGHIWLDIDDGDALIEFVGDQYRSKPGFENRPAVEVSWYGAAAYAQWAEKRLPTEAEWEKAARGGLVGRRYPWGDKITHDNANYSGAEGSDKWDETAPVGSFPPNGYGVYDMAGNVFEWCMDEYDSNFYEASPTNNPASGRVVAFVDNDFADLETRRVCRGGSWDSDSYRLRVATRNGFDLENTSGGVGFRCVVSVNP